MSHLDDLGDAMSDRVRNVQRWLKEIGWPIEVDGVRGPQTRRAIERFQLGYCGPGAPLEVDGQLDDQTVRAIEWSAAKGGKCSEHFRYREFASKGNGDIVVHRALVRVLERLRDEVGRPVQIVSGYRDPFHNQRIGGAQFSQHLYGTAADVPESLRLSVGRAMNAGATGIGFDEDNGWVEHIDVRHVGPNNTTGAKVGSPTTWAYS